MNNALRSITIVGGGTAGWLAAAIIFAARNRRNDAEDLEITLIESPRVPTIGVGEATTLSMTWTMDLLALDEKDFFQKCDASLKAGVKFTNWDHAPDGSPSWYYHPFEAPFYLYGYPPAYHYHKRARAGVRQQPFAHSMVTLPALFDAGKAPRQAHAPDLEGLAAYSYHVDAGLFAGYLKEFCTNLGVRHVVDDVVDVDVDERGFITSLRLAERGAFPVEFVVDSTGFSGEIIRKTLDEPFVPYDDSLLCDRAVAIQVPHEPGASLPPYTGSTGLDAGWMWEVPLYSRRGLGYVYSSQFCDQDAALKELLAKAGADEKDVDPNHIKMHIGRSRRSWVNNCLAVGLASGFVEPLESTSIHFVQMSIRWFLDNFPDRDCSPALQDAYNDAVRDLYEEIRDFIAMHYHASNREDTPFWRAARTEAQMPDSLKALMERWRYKLPSVSDMPSRLSLFSEWNYIYVLYGKGFFDGISFPIEDFICDEDFDMFSQELAQKRAQALAMAPDHWELLRQIREEETAPWYRPEGAPVLEPATAALV